MSRMQMAQVQNDSKEFVDMPLKASPEIVLAAFSQLPLNSSQAAYKQFMNQWMYPPGYEVVKVEPVDWTPQPAFVGRLPVALQPLAISLQSKWKDLVRAFNHTGLCDGCYSSIPVPNPFVVAGGRFIEFYYWDSLWILQGLLVSDMIQTAHHLVENLLYLVDTYGFVPNGGRIYYLNRSQPPVLALMVRMLYEKDPNPQWLARVLPTLVAEHNFWTTYRIASQLGKSGKRYWVQRYNANTTLPRPESFSQDVHTASQLPADQRGECYRDLASGAESGWDFSSRWLKTWTSMSTIRTSSILPVDLNSILYVVESSLSQLFLVAGNATASAEWKALADGRRQMLYDVFWQPTANMWLDIPIIYGEKPLMNFYPSNLMPIWAGAYHQTPEEAFKLIKGLWHSITFPGGIPTSLIASDQQWDFPNAWAPLQQFIIDALDGLGLPEATAYADELANAWFSTNYCAWDLSSQYGGLFYEKYDVSSVGGIGGGGEYTVQAGFGWTNGVLLKILATRGDRLKVPIC